MKVCLLHNAAVSRTQSAEEVIDDAISHDRCDSCHMGLGKEIIEALRVSGFEVVRARDVVITEQTMTLGQFAASRRKAE